MRIDRRHFLAGGTALSAIAALGGRAGAAPASDPFAPQPGAWRNFQVTTRVEIAAPPGPTRAWVPLPSVTADDWLRPLGDHWTIAGRQGGEAPRRPLWRDAARRPMARRHAKARGRSGEPRRHP